MAAPTSERLTLLYADGRKPLLQMKIFDNGEYAEAMLGSRSPLARRGQTKASVQDTCALDEVPDELAVHGRHRSAS
jgi:hypothetical protein